MEPSFASSFGDVRVHTDPAAPPQQYEFIDETGARRQVSAVELATLRGQAQARVHSKLAEVKGNAAIHRTMHELFLEKIHGQPESLLDALSSPSSLIAIAVDTWSRIETVLPETVRLNSTGLVTLERARLLTDVTGPGWSARDLHEATKLTVYLGRQERVDRVPAFIAVCDLLHRRGLDGATALLGVDGTAHGRRERATFFSRNAEVPMMVIAVGSGMLIGSVLPELGALLRRPLLTLERVRICKRDGLLLAAPPALPGADEHGIALWHKLMVYTSEAVQYHGEPIHRAIVRRLRSAGLSGATTQRGIWGFHGDHAPHGDRLLQLGRHVPAVTIVIDTPERVSAAFSVIDELTSERGLVTSETIPALRASSGDRQRGGTRLATHHLPPQPTAG